MRRLITLVNDNHVDKYLKKLLVYVDYGSVVNNRPINYTNHSSAVLSISNYRSILLKTFYSE